MLSVSFNSSDTTPIKGGEEDSFSPSSFTLYLTEIEQKEIIYSHTLYGEEEIRFWYIHSSDHTPVEQRFTISNEGHLVLEEERYSWYGAGLEFGSGLDFEFQGDQVIVSGYDRSFASLFIRVARTVPQKLIIDENELLLSDLAAGGSRILLQIKKD